MGRPSALTRVSDSATVHAVHPPHDATSACPSTMCRLLRLGPFVLLSALLWGGACSEPGDTGRDGPDVGCEIGSTEQRGCNVCQCTAQEGWQCTVRACGDADARVSVVPDGGFEDAGPRYGLDDAGEGRDVGVQDGAEAPDARDTGGSRDTRDTTARDIPSKDGTDDTERDDTGRRDGADDTSADGGGDASSDVRGVSPSDTGDATETFACGPVNKRCRVGAEYCLDEIPGVAPPDGGPPSSSYRCKSYGSCGPNPDCPCLKDREPIGGDVVGECTKRRPGVFEVRVAFP